MRLTFHWMRLADLAVVEHVRADSATEDEGVPALVAGAALDQAERAADLERKPPAA